MNQVFKKVESIFTLRYFKRLLVVVLLTLSLCLIVYLFYFLNNQTENNALNLNDNLNKNNLPVNSSSDNCCAECLDAANKDPSGYDISIKECLAYDLSDDCEEYFMVDKLRVGECG